MMMHLWGRGKNKKDGEHLKMFKRRVRDSFSTPTNIFLKYGYVFPDDDKKKCAEAFLYGNKKKKYQYITLEQLPCGDMFRNKHHMQYDPTTDWHVPVNDIYYVSRKAQVPKRKPLVAPKVVSSKLEETFQMRPRRMTDRRKSMNPRGIYERPPMNPDPKGMYNGFGRKSTFIRPPNPPPVIESSGKSEDDEELDERPPVKVRIKDLFKGHGLRKQSVFTALKLENLQKHHRQLFTDPPTPLPEKAESSSSSEPQPKPQKLVKRRVKDKVHSPTGSTSSRSSIFIKWERTMEDDDDPQSREPLYEYGGSENSNTPKKRVKASYEKYAICNKKHLVVADVCLACEKNETYGLFTKTLKTEPWKLPQGRPDPRDTKVVCSPTDKRKWEGVPHSRLPVCYMFDHEVDHTYHKKKAAHVAKTQAKMRKHLSRTLRKHHCHLYKPIKNLTL